MRAQSHVLIPALVALVLALAAVLGHAQNTTKRLILKDGSYQLVTKWEIQGDRVHYFSAERQDWEDVPNSLIDWDATNQFEKDRAAQKESPEALALDKEIEEEEKADEAKSPHVAPGLRLPPEGGVYALDTYLSEAQLVPLDQNNGEVERHVKRNVLRAAINPVGSSKKTIELAGPRSKVQVHASLPTVYVNLAPEEEPDDQAKAALPWDRFRIVHVQVKGDRRIVGAIKTAVYGKVSQEQELIQADAEQLGEGWVKITPKAPLEPGEYAVAEMLGKEGMNSYVWDFGMHPDAPANLSVIRPEHPEAEHTAQPEGLKQRK